MSDWYTSPHFHCRQGDPQVSQILRSGLRLTFAALDPINQLAFAETPLAADFERGQIAAANHPLQSLGRDMEQLSRLSEGQ